jgi:hypothetical protein
VREPTAEECSAHTPVTLDETLSGVACWYPQMGGYWGKAVAVADGGCVDVYVWHDGDFPFGEDGRPPVELHHCDGGQFVAFGQFLEAFTQESAIPEEPASSQINLDELREGLARFGEAISRDARASVAAAGVALSGTKPPAPEEPAETRMWQFAIRVPEGREGELTKLINESSAEVYQAWPVSGEKP